jgi:hypothetical protein
LPTATNKTEGLANFIGKKLPPKLSSVSVSPNNKSGLGKEAKDRASRMKKVERAKEILSGKISIVWIFAISTAIEE